MLRIRNFVTGHWFQTGNGAMTIWKEKESDAKVFLTRADADMEFTRLCRVASKYRKQIEIVEAQS